MVKDSKEKEITLTKETVDVLVTNIIPTTKYFETRFDFMQHQIDETKDSIKNLEKNMNLRFKQVDERFKQVDERFAQVDRRFEQVDKRFEQIERDIRDLREGVGTLSEKISELTTEVKTSVRDYIIERDRYYGTKFNHLRMFNYSDTNWDRRIIFKSNRSL